METLREVLDQSDVHIFHLSVDAPDREHYVIPRPHLPIFYAE